MPSISCVCGCDISLSELPNPHEYLITSDALVEKLVDEIAALATGAHQNPRLKRDLYRLFRRHEPPLAVAYECPNCGRLLIFRGYQGRTTDGTLVYRLDDAATRVASLKSFFAPAVAAENKAP